MIHLHRLAASLCVLLTLIHHVDASVTSQFHLKPTGQDVSKCFMNCHNAVSLALPVSWAHENGEYYITKNCETSEYIDTMKICITSLCETSWDAQYAVEYGTIMCRKAGVKVDFSLPASYTSTAAGFYATATIDDLTSRATKAQAAMLLVGLSSISTIVSLVS